MTEKEQKRQIVAKATDLPAYKNPSLRMTATATADDEQTIAKALADAAAQTFTRPEVNAAVAIEQWQQDTHDVNALVTELNRQVDAVNGGDMRRAEAMLIAQAHTLDQIFMNLARRAVKQDLLRQWEAHMRMAMKAQSQCRMTLETLATVKNPQVVFAKQANINNGGQQQVNNGIPTDPTRAQEIEPSPSKLLEKQDGKWLDTRAQGAPSGADQELETVGARQRDQRPIPVRRRLRRTHGREGSGR